MAAGATIAVGTMGETRVYAFLDGELLPKNAKGNFIATKAGSNLQVNGSLSSTACFHVMLCFLLNTPQKKG